MKLSILMPAGGAIAECEWRARSFEWVTSRYTALFPDAELVFGVSNSEPYNRAEARNDAFDKSTGDMLLVADADTVVNRGQVFKGIQQIRELGAPWVVPYDELRYYNLAQAATAYMLESPSDSDVPEPIEDGLWEHKITSWGGLVMMPRTAWQAVGGYDDRFTGWGYEDNAMRFALDRVVGPHRRVRNHFVAHLWHPTPEDQCFGQPQIAENRALCLRYERGELP